MNDKYKSGFILILQNEYKVGQKAYQFEFHDKDIIEKQIEIINEAKKIIIDLDNLKMKSLISFDDGGVAIISYKI